MKEAYIKALQVISSCINYKQTRGAYNYIHNFRVLYGDTAGCEKLAKILMEKCTKHRRLLDRR
jgi:hypothetical protein